MPSSIKKQSEKFRVENRKKHSYGSYDGSFTNETTLEGCTYHLDKNKDYINDNVTYVTLEIYIDGVNEPIISNTLTITAFKKIRTNLDINLFLLVVLLRNITAYYSFPL